MQREKIWRKEGEIERVICREKRDEARKRREREEINERQERGKME
jgi:hypothetical protein